jgi:type IV fimbrial biogenesis protein FimT
MFSSKQSTATRPPVGSGFTLIELMVTISIAAILGTLALPSYTAIMTKQRLSNENTNLMLDFVLARGEALTRSTRVTVCQSADGATCSNGGWETGRVVFVDRTTAGSIDAGDEILKVSAAIASGDVMSAGATTAISYNAAGIPSTNITIITCKSGYTGAKLMIYPTGRLRADSHGACI